MLKKQYIPEDNDMADNENIDKFIVATYDGESMVVYNIATNTEIAHGSYEEMQALCTRLNASFLGKLKDFENWKYNPGAPIQICLTPMTREEYDALPHISGLTELGLKVPNDMELSELMDDLTDGIDKKK
jgi:hypothetical protein